MNESTEKAPVEGGAGPPRPIRIRVVEFAAAPPAYTAVQRQEFARSTLLELTKEFGGRVQVDYQALAGEPTTFLVQVCVHDEMLSQGWFPPRQLLRLVVARHLAMEQMVEDLICEARGELEARGLEVDCWQDALLLLASPEDYGETR